MKKNRKSTRVMRIIAWTLLSLLVFVFFLPVFTSCEDVKDPDNYKEDLEIITTVPTQLIITEPTYIHVELPDSPDYPQSEDLLTIFDVESAIDLCEEFLDKCNAVQLVPETEHPQTGELVALTETAQEYKSAYERILAEHWYNREQAHPVMTKIWHYLINEGKFNYAVASGIIGNMCAESGGCGYGDIDINNWDDATGNSYYGICQWSIEYHPNIANKSLDYQLDYLLDSYEYSFTHYGSNYSSRYGSKFRTEQFLAMEDPYEAAIAFAVCYERCNSKHVEHRGPLADKTYTYFTVLGSWPWPSPESKIN